MTDREKAEKIVSDAGYDASFSGISKTQYGTSIYFLTTDGKKIRVSDHSVLNTDRVFNEIHLRFERPTLPNHFLKH